MHPPTGPVLDGVEAIPPILDMTCACLRHGIGDPILNQARISFSVAPSKFFDVGQKQGGLVAAMVERPHTL